MFDSKAYMKAYRKFNKEELSVYHSKYYKDNRADLSERHKKYFESNPEKKSGSNKKYFKSHKKEIFGKIKTRLKLDVQFKISRNLRSRLSNELRHNLNGNTKSSFELLGIPLDEFKIFIQNKFLPGMNWDNWGPSGWHLDHIIPVSYFNLTDRNQLEKAFNYTNYQPLWAFDNLSKSSKLNWSKEKICKDY